MADTYDYIVIGAGSAGCALAARLSENSNISVLLLEAGSPDKSLSIHMPGMLINVVPPNKLNWNYYTEPQSYLNDRKLFCPRGKVMGGSSSINGLLYVRGNMRDYDEWAQLGCTGWSWDDVLPYFKKSEGSDRPADELHATDGPLLTSRHTSTNPINEAFLAAGKEMGLPDTDDFNGAHQEGLGWYDQTIKQGRRQSAAKAYIHPALKRPNLTVITGAQARRILLSGKKATGVEVSIKDQIKTFHAGKEVLLSGGAINSPQLMQLSGIGDPADIQAVGLPVMHELPAVGKNLQDHLDVTIYSELNCPLSVSKYQKPYRAIYELAKWFLKKPGVLSDCVTPVGGFLKTDPALERPDIQLHIMLAMAGKPHGFEGPQGHGYGIHICQLRPHSKGTISLSCSDPLAPAKIDPKYLSDAEDRRVIRKGVQIVRDLMAQPALMALTEKERSPWRDIANDDDGALDTAIRDKAETIYHPVGTCAMGPVDQSTTVVTPELKVKGLEGLRVVDASVMPRLIGGNTNAPTIMIAEKCADMIKAEYKH